MIVWFIGGCSFGLHVIVQLISSWITWVSLKIYLFFIFFGKVAFPSIVFYGPNLLLGLVLLEMVLGLFARNQNC